MSKFSAYLRILLWGMFFCAFTSLAAQEEAIRIGFLVPDSTRADLILAAELAVESANAERVNGSAPISLVVRSTEGPWGAGSKESVSLVYEDHVSVIVGALDGRNGHLAEQVATKSHLAYLETRATESTLSQAFVPWFLRCVPSDDQQAAAFLSLIARNGGGKVVVLSDHLYDHRHAAESFRRIAAKEQFETPVFLDVEAETSDPGNLIDKLKQTRAEHLVIPFQSESTLQLISTIRKVMPRIRIYGTLGSIMEMAPSDPDWNLLEGVVTVAPGEFDSDGWIQFCQRYTERSGEAPPVAAGYIYDGISLVTRAIRKAGADREHLRTYLPSFTEPEGITGSLSFDGSGNRKETIHFMVIRNGVPQSYP